MVSAVICILRRVQDCFIQVVAGCQTKVWTQLCPRGDYQISKSKQFAADLKQCINWLIGEYFHQHQFCTASTKVAVSHEMCKYFSVVVSGGDIYNIYTIYNIYIIY